MNKNCLNNDQSLDCPICDEAGKMIQVEYESTIEIVGRGAFPVVLLAMQCTACDAYITNAEQTTVNKERVRQVQALSHG